MDDWDLLFLQAAGKTKRNNLKRNAEEHREAAPPDVIATARVPPTEVSVFNQQKKAKLIHTRGVASKCLNHAGFRFAETEDFKCKKSFAARYRLMDAREAEGNGAGQSIRAMFVIVRNCRAVGFAPRRNTLEAKSISEANSILRNSNLSHIRESYRRKIKTVTKWLVEMRNLAAKCQEVSLTRQYIEDCQSAFRVVTEGSEDSDDEDEFSDDVISSGKGSDNYTEKEQQKQKIQYKHRKQQHKKRQQNLLRRAKCLELISGLDLIYGELLVAALDAGISLPDPRLYMETLSGQVENCVKSLKQNNVKCSSSSSSGSDSINNNPLLRYLQLRDIEAEALNIPSLSKSAVEVEGLSPGPDEGTMRGIDPLSSPIIRKYWHACRYRVAAWSAFACPNNQAISALKIFAPGGILEMGAGTGYWARMLRNQAVNVLSYDKTPPMEGRNGKKGNSNEYHGRFPAWSEVLHGDANGVSGMCNSNSASRTLFMCYPPPDDPMAVRAIQGFQGSKFACVGEILGDTGTLDFDSKLRAQWDLVGKVSLPNFGNTCYLLTMWQRKVEIAGGSKAGGRKEEVSNEGLRVAGVGIEGVTAVDGLKVEGNTKWPFECAACGAFPSCTEINTGKTGKTGETGTKTGKVSPNYFYRDRLTRVVWSCSIECSRSEACRGHLKEQMRLRHIGYGMDLIDGSGGSGDGGASDGDRDEDYDMLWKRVTL